MPFTNRNAANAAVSVTGPDHVNPTAGAIASVTTSPVDGAQITFHVSLAYSFNFVNIRIFKTISRPNQPDEVEEMFNWGRGINTGGGAINNGGNGGGGGGDDGDGGGDGGGRRSRSHTPGFIRGFSRTRTATPAPSGSLNRISEEGPDDGETQNNEQPPDGGEGGNMGKRERLKSKIKNKAGRVRGKFSRDKGNNTNNNNSNNNNNNNGVNNGDNNGDEGHDDNDGNNNNNNNNYNNHNNGPPNNERVPNLDDEPLSRILVIAHHCPLSAGRLLKSVEYSWPIKFEGLHLHGLIEYIKPKQGNFGMLFEFANEPTIRDCTPDVLVDWIAAPEDYPQDQVRKRQYRRVHVFQESEETNRPPAENFLTRLKDALGMHRGVTRIHADHVNAAPVGSASGDMEDWKKNFEDEYLQKLDPKLTWKELEHLSDDEKENVKKMLRENWGTLGVKGEEVKAEQDKSEKDKARPKAYQEKEAIQVDKFCHILDRDTTAYDERMDLEQRYIIDYSVDYIRDLLKQYVPYSNRSSATTLQ